METTELTGETAKKERKDTLTRPVCSLGYMEEKGNVWTVRCHEALDLCSRWPEALMGLCGLLSLLTASDIHSEQWRAISTDWRELPHGVQSVRFPVVKDLPTWIVCDRYRAETSRLCVCTSSHLDQFYPEMVRKMLVNALRLEEIIMTARSVFSSKAYMSPLTLDG